MAPSWREVQQANEEKRCELIFSGPHFSKLIEEDGLDPDIFKIKHLNYLEVSRTCLKNVPSELGELKNLTRLVLCYNCLQSMPSSIDQLRKLKIIDVSFNSINELPDCLNNLTDIQSINVSNNKLSSLPNLNGLVKLVSLNIACNNFTEFPVTVCDSGLIHFSEIIANNNSIESLPADIGKLGVLKVLNLGDNKLSEVPGELASCTKLKELNLKGNKLKDKRLLKLVEQCHVKQVMEYVRSHCSKSSSEDAKQVKSKRKAKQNKKVPEDDESTQLLDQIKVLHVQDETIKVISTARVQDVRPYILCCILRSVSFSKENSMKKFITMQTKLHENVCEKRTLATIATHDLAKIKGNLLYDAKLPEEIKILPLHHKKELTAAQLFAHLNEDADALRKEKKKNAYSGVHKYLYLLKDKSVYPYLADDSGQVVSFPPITNSDGTKVSDETKDIFVEVTGNNLPPCKKVMDTLLQEVLKLGIGIPDSVPNTTDEDTQLSQCYLTIEQVKVVNEEGHLKAVYPSRTDIQLEGINVIRA